MNFFKKALVASAVLASFGAAAEATVSSTALQLSKEGIADGVTADDQALVFDVVVGVDTPAASTITLTFDKTVDLNGVLQGAVTNTPGTGIGLVGTANDANAVQFNYGTGSFTFDNVVVTDKDQTKGEQDSISFKVNLGNALTAGSAFRITLGDVVGANGGEVDFTGGASLAYKSVAADGTTVIETGTGVVAEETAQFGFKVATPFSKLINRTDQTIFTTDTIADDAETAVVEYTNNETLAAALTAPALTFVVDGSFTALVDNDFEITTTNKTGSAAPATPLTDAAAAATLNADKDELTVALAAVNASADGTTLLSVEFAKTVALTEIPATGPLLANASILATNGDSQAAGKSISIATDASAGQWKIDATIINVPYFPVGFEGTSSSVHLANEGSLDVDVRVSAIATVDADGKARVYKEVDLGMDLPGQSVTKITQGKLMELLGVPAGTKLSVTFNVDANEGVVNGYAFTTDETGRTEISTSQQRGN